MASFSTPVQQLGSLVEWGKQVAAAPQQQQQQQQQQQRAAPQSSPEEELICPITQELVLDPVMADDGTIYERTAIEQYFATTSTHGRFGEVKSPVKGIMMDQKLIPAPQIKALIEKLIDNGSFQGALADTWKFQRLLKKAEKGDIRAMEEVGDCYKEGKWGLQPDMDKAKEWHDKAYQARRRKILNENLKWASNWSLRAMCSPIDLCG